MFAMTYLFVEKCIKSLQGEKNVLYYKLQELCDR